MSKKQFDNIEDKIKEAVESHQPAFNNSAWEKMAVLLDKEGSRKRPAILWHILPLLLLIAAGGGYFIYENTTVKKNTITSKLNVKNVAINSTTKVAIQKNEKGVFNITKKNKNEKSEPTTKKIAAISNSIIKGEVANYKENLLLKDNYSNKHNKSYKSKKASIEWTKIKANNDFSAAQKNIALNAQHNYFEKTNSVIPSEETKNLIVTNNENKKNNDKYAKENSAVEALHHIDTTDILIKEISETKKIKAEKIPVPLTAKKNKTIVNKNRFNRFYILATIGADAASVKFLSFSNSILAPTYGIGAGFQLTKKWSVQAGFYAGQKKYVAGPGDYHAKAGSYWSQVEIKKVDAVCMVYEIPLALRYTFSQKKSVAFFATAGFSSYIMKKEDYFYNYIHYNMPLSGRYIYTGNKNFFSVLNFSVGIEKKLSSHFSLIASPNLSIPVAGVGDGSIKLFSAGLQTGIIFQPGNHLK